MPQVLNQRVVLLSHDSTNLVDKITSQTMVKDGAARLWSFNAGLDTTKDPPRSTSSPYRMKASVDEQHLKDAVTMTAACMTEADTAIFIAGRNALVEKDLFRELASIKPRLAIKNWPWSQMSSNICK